MLVCALAPNFAVAYDTANCGLYRVWSGEVKFQGKVYDFSQKSTETLGTTYHLSNGTLLSVENESTFPVGWTRTGTVTPSSTDWSFGSANATLTSPAVDLREYDRVMLHFEESSGSAWAGVPGAGSIKVQVSVDDGATWAAQEFYSSSRKGVQENYKLIPQQAERVRFRFTSTNGKIRNIRVQGNYRAWRAAQGGADVSVRTEWRGHSLIDRTAGVKLKYDLVLHGEQRVSIHEQPEVVTDAGNIPMLRREFTVSGLPAGTMVSLKLNRAAGVASSESWQVSGSGALRSAGSDQYLDITSNGTCIVTGTWQ